MAIQKLLMATDNKLESGSPYVLRYLEQQPLPLLQGALIKYSDRLEGQAETIHTLTEVLVLMLEIAR